MKYSIIILLSILVFLTGFKSIEITNTQAQEPKVVIDSIEIDANASKVWDILTNKDYAKELGSVFVKNGFVESDWKLNSSVYFKSEPDKIISTGTITKIQEKEFIQVVYNFNGFGYVEKFSIEKSSSGIELSIYAGPHFGSNFDMTAQKNIWQIWLSKVKELSENE